MKTAFLYAGQGSQTIGMARVLIENHEVAKAIFDRADKVLGWSVTDLCLNDPNSNLNDTKWTQPALLTHSVAAHHVALSMGYSPDYVMGLSLGEYSAITANGGLTFEEGVTLVHRRGSIMQEAVPKGAGAMFAILGLDIDKIIKICNSHSNSGIIEPANINCPGQIVVGGEKEVVNNAINDFKKAGAKRCIELNVAGPFHTSMLRSAAKKFSKELDAFNFNKLNVDLVTNTTGALIDESLIKDNLAKQMYCSVQLEEGIKFLFDQGGKQFIELGPNKVLTGFVKKTAKHYGLEDIEAFNLESKLGEK